MARPAAKPGQTRKNLTGVAKVKAPPKGTRQGQGRRSKASHGRKLLRGQGKG